MKIHIITAMSLLLWVILPSIVYSADIAPAQVPLNTNSDPTESLIDKLWRQSYEEEKPESKTHIYRTDDSKAFPPSRFRMAYKFMRDGVCEWYYLSPDDNHRFKKGTWSIDVKDKSKIMISTESGVNLYKIISITKDMIELMELNQLGR